MSLMKLSVRHMTLLGLLSISLTLCEFALGESQISGYPGSLSSSIAGANRFAEHSKAVNSKFNPLKKNETSEANFKKLDLAGDRANLQRGFKLAGRSGTESGGGGSGERDLFYSVMRKAISVLKRESEFKFKDGEVIEVTRLENALRATTLIPTQKQLFDREGVPVDLFNDPDDLVIWFNVPKWKNKTETEKIQLGFHEILGILVIPDPAYKFSNQLQLAAATLSKITPSLTEVQDTKVDQKFVSDFLQSSKSARDNVVLSYQCEKFAPSHKGFCLIQSQIQDGAIHQKVYLVEGTPEDFKNNKSANITVGLYRIVTDIPPNELNFVLSLMEWDAGHSEILGNSQCVARGYIKESGAKSANFCIFANFPTSAAHH